MPFYCGKLTETDFTEFLFRYIVSCSSISVNLLKQISLNFFSVNKKSISVLYSYNQMQKKMSPKNYKETSIALSFINFYNHDYDYVFILALTTLVVVV